MPLDSFDLADRFVRTEGVEKVEREATDRGKSKRKKDICFQQMSFFLGFGRLSRPKPSGILMLAVGRAAPAQFSAAGREFTRRSAHGPEGPDRRCISSNSPKAKNIDFNRSLQNETGLVETSRNSF